MSTFATAAAAVPLEQFLNDVNKSTTEKVDCLKLLQVVLQNLNDPAKAADSRYRQLRLENAKIQKNLTQHASMMQYLQMIGFALVQQDGERFLRVQQPPNDSSNNNNWQAAWTQITAALERVNKQLLQHQTSSGSSTSVVLSEKQKARLLADEKKRKEKEVDRLAHKKTQALIKADKHVRVHDPNWKPTVSAAAAKSGTAMQTFRDKFGE